MGASLLALARFIFYSLERFFMSRITPNTFSRPILAKIKKAKKKLNF